MYPSKEQIFSLVITFDIVLLKKIAEWKKSSWLPIRSKTKAQKQIAIVNMIDIICKHHNKPVSILLLQKNNDYAYNSKKKQIIMGAEPSIISALHEIGHHIYGPLELNACRFSTQLFKEAFPIAYKKLKWRGHMLKKQ